MAKQATKDQIICAVHICWERGIEVSPTSVQERLRDGFHEECSVERIEAALLALEQPGEKERWLSQFQKQ